MKNSKGVSDESTKRARREKQKGRRRRNSLEDNKVPFYTLSASTPLGSLPPVGRRLPCRPGERYLHYLSFRRDRGHCHCILQPHALEPPIQRHCSPSVGPEAADHASKGLLRPSAAMAQPICQLPPGSLLISRACQACSCSYPDLKPPMIDKQ